MRTVENVLATQQQVYVETIKRGTYLITEKVKTLKKVIITQQQVRPIKRSTHETTER
jgi:hypothetical protein